MVSLSRLNLKVAFIPGLRASADDFWLALGVIALIDAVRLSISPTAGLLSWLVVAFFALCAFMNRLRDAGRAPTIAFILLIGASVIKALSGLFAMAWAIMPQVLTYLEENLGVDPDDPAQFYDPQIQRAYQDWLVANPEIVMSALGAGAWPSVWGFWLTLVIAGVWVSRPSRR